MREGEIYILVGEGGRGRRRNTLEKDLNDIVG